MSRELILAIKGHEKYVSVKDRVKNIKQHFDIEELDEEISGLHKLLPARSLTFKLIQREKNALVDALLQNQASRSRIAEIYTQAVKYHSLLEDMVDTLKVYLRLTFKDEMKVLGTQKAKDDFLSQNMVYFYNEIQELSRLVKTAKLILDDVDQTYWHLKAVADIVSTMAKVREL